MPRLQTARWSTSGTYLKKTNNLFVQSSVSTSYSNRRSIFFLKNNNTQGSSLTSNSFLLTLSEFGYLLVVTSLFIIFFFSFGVVLDTFIHFLINRSYSTPLNATSTANYALVSGILSSNNNTVFFKEVMCFTQALVF